MNYNTSTYLLLTGFLPLDTALRCGGPESGGREGGGPALLAIPKDVLLRGGGMPREGDAAGGGPLGVSETALGGASELRYEELGDAVCARGGGATGAGAGVLSEPAFQRDVQSVDAIDEWIGDLLSC